MKQRFDKNFKENAVSFVLEQKKRRPSLQDTRNHLFRSAKRRKPCEGAPQVSSG